MPEFKIKRKLFRLVGLLFPLLYVTADSTGIIPGWVAATVLLLLFLGIMFALEWARFSRPGVNRWLFDRFRGFTKEKERARTSSTTLFLMACLVTILVFGKWVAIAAMLMLVFGDPLAELVGTRWGRIPLIGKTLEGTLAGFAACCLASAPLLAAPSGPAFAVLLCGAVAATLFELLPAGIDDNFTIPLGAGAGMTLAQVLGWGAGAPLPLLSPALESAARLLAR